MNTSITINRKINKELPDVINAIKEAIKVFSSMGYILNSTTIDTIILLTIKPKAIHKSINVLMAKIHLNKSDTNIINVKTTINYNQINENAFSSLLNKVVITKLIRFKASSFLNDFIKRVEKWG